MMNNKKEKYATAVLEIVLFADGEIVTISDPIPDDDGGINLPIDTVGS